ncbi:MAG TPA: UDP-N-acetylmuramoyl-tripeptide--D-alanyl-D-alanine ligase, partial [Bacilli bacterium]|nr:UDP-N-acetylmuramoyl-tripeptide--D-alanyl-D-alanine ligase [Bacilli bacterium]
EMGANKTGEIKELCDLVQPKYGILTKIGTAHLETFGSEKNILNTKFELIESLPSDGIGVLNGDDEKQLNYKLKNKCKILWIGIDNKDVDIYAKNIKVSNTGTSFDVVFKDDDKVYNFKTKLLGYANVYNILASLALAKEFDLTIDQMLQAVSNIKQIEHRLELKPSGNITYIDDAYNSNPIGSKMALDVLKIMPGKRYVVTPGMIELGSKEYELNKEFGKQIKDSCDIVILVGEKQTKPIYDGLIENNMDKDNINIVKDIKQGLEIIRKDKDKNIFVLLENDLPDIFNE